MTEKPTVTVIIPARNEAENLPSTLASIQTLAQQIIVVDDGSHDDTGIIAARSGAEVLRRHHDPGKGQSLAYGLTRAQGDIIAFLDADLGASGGEMAKLVQCVAYRGADLAIARIDRVGAPGWGLVSRTSQRLLARHGVNVTQPLCGQRALNRHALEKLLPLARGWGVEVAMLIKAARHQLIVKEVPTAMYHAGTGRSYRGIMHRARQGLEIAATLGKMTLTSWR